MACTPSMRETRRVLCCFHIQPWTAAVLFKKLQFSDGLLDEIAQSDYRSSPLSVGLQRKCNFLSNRVVPDPTTDVRQDQFVCGNSVNRQDGFTLLNARLVCGATSDDIHDREVLSVLSHPHSGVIITVPPAVVFVLFENESIARII